MADPNTLQQAAADAATGSSAGTISAAIAGAITTVAAGLVAWLKGRAGRDAAMAEKIDAAMALKIDALKIAIGEKVDRLASEIAAVKASVAELRAGQASHETRDESEKQDIKRSIDAMGVELRRALDTHVDALGERIGDLRAFVTSGRRG